MHPDSLLCVVEIPRGGRNKYEYDPKLGVIKLDRFISASDNRVAAFEAIEKAREAFRENGGY